MKEMDPDTPYRLLHSNSNVVERKNDIHVDGHSRISDPRHQSLDQMQNLAIASQQGRCNGASKFKISRKTRTDNIEHPNKCIIDLSSSPLPSHSDRTLKFRRVALEKPIQEKADDRSLKADRASHKPSGQQSFPKQIPDNHFPNDSKEEEKREGSLKLGCPSNYRNDTSTMCGYSSKGKEKTFELCGVPLDAGVRHDGEFWSANNSMSPCQTTVMVAPKAPTSASKLVHIVESPKRGPKRFVRNGLISPKNIAKGKMIAGQNSCVRDAEQNIEGSAVHIDPQALIDIYGSRAEGKGNGVSKGKSVKSHLQMTNKVDIGAQSLNDRDTVIHTEDYNEVIGAKEEVGNWIRTHSHPQNSGRPISNLRINSTASLGGSQYSEERKYETSSLNKTPEEGGELHQNGIPIPSFNGHGHSYSATESSIGTKRCRRVHSSTRQQITSQGLPNILISEPSSSRVNDSVSSNGDNMDARNWQLEADERLARELQEQLYQEDNLYRGREMDANIAMALLQDEQEEHASAAGTRPLFNPGASVAHRMPRQPRLRSSQPSSRMRGVRHRLYGRSRGARPRSGVRVSDPSNFMGSFPFDMSVDTWYNYGLS